MYFTFQKISLNNCFIFSFYITLDSLNCFTEYNSESWMKYIHMISSFPPKEMVCLCSSLWAKLLKSPYLVKVCSECLIWTFSSIIEYCYAGLKNELTVILLLFSA